MLITVIVMGSWDSDHDHDRFRTERTSPLQQALYSAGPKRNTVHTHIYESKQR